MKTQPQHTLKLFVLIVLMLGYQLNAQNGDGEEVQDPNTENGGGGTLIPDDVEMPVDLYSFTIKKGKKEGIEITWITTSEINHAYFKLQVSTNDSVYHDVIQIEGTGNSFSKKSYFYHDIPLNEGYYLYRLVQVDFDGTTTIFKSQGILYSEASNNQLSICWPLPATDKLHIELTQSTLSHNNLEIEIYNMTGQLVKAEAILSHNNQFTIDIEALYSGIYTVVLYANRQQMDRFKIVKG